MRRLAVLAAVLGLMGCGGSVAPAGRCDGVRCEGAMVCEASTGRCVAPDGGSAAADAGPRDAGARDAGPVDGGAGDAGHADAGGEDAGVTDAGPRDAGAVDGGGGDAGPEDAGCGGDAECPGAARCEPQTRTCVECYLDAHCPSSVVPRCDVRDFTCQACVSNADCANPTPVCAARQCLPCASDAECGPGRECDRMLSGDCLPLPDSCANPRVILPAGLGATSFTAEPAQAIDDVTGSCGPGGPELVYAFTTGAVRSLAVTVAPLAGSLARPVVFLRASPCGAGAEAACDAPGGGSASLAVPSLAAGTWYLFVESAGSAPGRVAVTVSLTAPSLPPANDGCGAPESLTFVGSRAVAVGNTTLASNDATGPSCSATASTSGGDLAYAYVLTARSNVTVVARPMAGSPLHPVVSVRGTCGVAASEVGCQAQALAAAAQVTLPGQQPGAWTVWVDSADGTQGAFQLEVTATPVVDNDGCAGAEALVFSGGVATAVGDTSAATNGNAAQDQTPSCSDSARGTGRDVVYAYTLTQPRDVTVRVTPTGPQPSFEPVVSVRTSCAAATRDAEVGCVSLLDAGPTTVTLVNQPAGAYALWVDGARDTAGPFELEVVLSPPTPPPANDSCAAPEALVFNGDVATASGSTLQAANDNSGYHVSPTCSMTARQMGRDVVYRMTLAAPADVALEVTPAPGSALHPALYVRQSSCTSQILGDEVVCLESAGVATATLTALPAGDYWVWVDGAGGTAGAFTLTATRSPPTPPPANDACAGAQALTFVGDTATATGSTFGATNGNTPTDNAPACGDDFLPRRYGRDLVYTYTLTGAQDVDIRVTPGPGSALRPALYARSPGQCASFGAGDELGCVARATPGELKLYLPNQLAGTYPLFVDSNGYETGDFTLTVRKLPATLPPPNDGCAAPAVVPHGPAGVAGDTTGARNDFSLGSTPPYGPACRGFFFSGRDVTYQYTAPATGTVTATVTPVGLFDPALMLLQPTCGADACVRFADSGGAGVAESLTLSVTAGHTYYFVVDAWDGAQPDTAGAFRLVVQ